MQFDDSFVVQSLSLLEERYKKLYKIGEERLNKFENDKEILNQRIQDLELNNKLLLKKNEELELKNNSLFEKNKELENKKNDLEDDNEKLFAEKIASQKREKDNLIEFHSVQEQLENSASKVQELIINNKKLKINNDKFKEQIDSFEKNNNIHCNDLINQLHLDQEEFEKCFVFANDANALIAEQNEQLKIASKIIKKILPYLEKKNKFNFGIVGKKKFLNYKY